PSWLDLIVTRKSDSRGVRIWEASSGQVLGTLWGSVGFLYLPDGKAMLTWSNDGNIRIWDLPLRRPWYVDYGLPVLFALLVILGVRMMWRALCKPPASIVSGALVPNLAEADKT